MLVKKYPKSSLESSFWDILSEAIYALVRTSVEQATLPFPVLWDLYESYFMLLPRWMEYDYPTMDCQIDCPSLVSHHPMALDQNVGGLC